MRDRSVAALCWTGVFLTPPTPLTMVRTGCLPASKFPLFPPGAFAMSNEGNGDDHRRGEISPEDRASIKERSSEIARKLNEARGNSDNQTGAGDKGDRMANSPGGSSDGKTRNVEAMGRGLRMSTELVGGILVGSAMGWGLDTWLGTWPWFFILFFLLGSAAGMLNVVRAGLSMKSGPVDPSKGPRVPDDDENS